MAAFASFAAAEARAVAKVKDGTWINAHAAQGTLAADTFVVRVQRKMSTASAAAQQHGGWIELNDDAAV